jgi:hypothetical protein
MHEQQTGLIFRFLEIIPGIISIIIMQKNPSVQAAHENLKKYYRGCMINGKRENFPADDKMQKYCSAKQVKEKQKVSQHGNFT